jgi:hypothetical protein
MSSRYAVLGLACLVVSCGADEPRWSVTQAESIATVRGTPINDPTCRGVGEATDDRYERFRCRAGARRPSETVDTVAVLYELLPTGDYPDHTLENVSFVGGPGIP